VRVQKGKTEAATREVVLPEFLVQSLATEMKTDGRVFPFSERNVGRALDAALERAGLEHVRFHDLRHTFASILVGQGEDVTYVADQLGHASPATPRR
jgi:integrase